MSIRGVCIRLRVKWGVGPGLVSVCVLCLGMGDGGWRMADGTFGMGDRIGCGIG